MKDMGEASYVLGVKIFKDFSKLLLSLSQETYIKKMLKRYHMHDCKPMDTLIKKNMSLSLDMCPKKLSENEQMSKVPYSNVVGCLMYAMMCTCLDISHVIGVVRRFQSNLGSNHWMIVKRILRYLKGTPYYVLYYPGKNLWLVGHTNVDLGGDLD